MSKVIYLDSAHHITHYVRKRFSPNNLGTIALDSKLKLIGAGVLYEGDIEKITGSVDFVSAFREITESAQKPVDPRYVILFDYREVQ